MILQCSACNTKYLIADSFFTGGQRKVRCAKCKAEWIATLPNNIDVVETAPNPDIEFSDVLKKENDSLAENNNESESPKVSSESRKINLPAVIDENVYPKWLIAFMAVALIASWIFIGIILERDSIVKTLPETQEFYSVLGIAAKPAWDGLVFEDIFPEISYQDGTSKLVVSGKIYNSTEDFKDVPNVRIEALGLNDNVIKSWTMPLSVSSVGGLSREAFKEVLDFNSSFSIENVRIDFVEE
ncbi:MAG: zinc-ribbon domain-containing protein [Alphaproteobacteria bacterium]|nr:zinc-ribbon domain-containing protein [Alphaproteobacteria bacterium]MCL2504950.1 zinc-ribbon domain-containing protein [Alphaproteobacteria bacterium]